MSNNDQMTIDERRKYLRMMKKRYVKANSKKAKGLLLYEMEAVTGLDRKTLIRLMNSSLERKPRSRQRGAIYGPDVDDALRVIYESCDYICAERLTPSLVWMAQHLAAHGELAVTPSLLEHLGQISVSTVQRRLLRITQDQYQLPRRKPKPRHRLTQSIPMLRLPWNILEPGRPSTSSGHCFETDLVHHCGPRAMGEYACTLQMIDVATGWSEHRAVLGRSYLVMEDAFRRILARLPFPILQIHPDNGSLESNDATTRPAPLSIASARPGPSYPKTVNY